MSQWLEVLPPRQPRETSVLHTIADTARDISALFGLQGSGPAPHTAHGQSWAESGQQSQKQHFHLAQPRPQRVYVQAAAPALPQLYRNVSLPPQRAQQHAHLPQPEQRRQPAHHALEPARPRPQPPHQHPHRKALSANSQLILCSSRSTLQIALQQAMRSWWSLRQRASALAFSIITDAQQLQMRS